MGQKFVCDRCGEPTDEGFSPTCNLCLEKEEFYWDSKRHDFAFVASALKSFLVITCDLMDYSSIPEHIKVEIRKLKEAIREEVEENESLQREVPKLRKEIEKLKERLSKNVRAN